MTRIVELPIVFPCQSEQLIGIIHKPDSASTIGVLIVVGGSQYRAGSHRQFVLLARMLAENSIPTMRFDYRGMGDSQGEARSFLTIDKDISSAIDTFYENMPNLKGIVIWGLCDAASAASFYAYQDKRIKGLVLLNPWVFTEQGAAKTYFKYYYLQHLFHSALWRKVFSFQFDYRQSFSSLVIQFKSLFESTNNENNKTKYELSLVDSRLSLPDRVLSCLNQFKNPILFILSGRDLTANEFREIVKTDKKQYKIFEKADVSKVELMDADHTFSSQEWREQVEQITLNWVMRLN